MQNADEELTPKKGRERKQDWLREVMDQDASLTEPGPVGHWSKYYHQSCPVLVGMARHLPNSVIRYTQLWKGKVTFCIWEELTAGDHLPTALAPSSWAQGLL